MGERVPIAELLEKLGDTEAALLVRLLAAEVEAWRAEDGATHTCAGVPRGIENPATYPCEGCERHAERYGARLAARAATDAALDLGGGE